MVLLRPGKPGKEQWPTAAKPHNNKTTATGPAETKQKEDRRIARIPKQAAIDSEHIFGKTVTGETTALTADLSRQAARVLGYGIVNPLEKEVRPCLWQSSRTIGCGGPSM
jgi:hypothetical protein